MKQIAAFIFILFLFVSCAPQKEVIQPPKETSVLPPSIPEKKPESPPGPKKFQKILACEEKTEDLYNKSGIEVLPFIRLSFYDMDNDGRQELIAGSKDGTLRLYKRASSGQSRKWEPVDGYFDGIRVGAFSSPAIGDIDGDNRPDVAVGTGGFSSESGRVLVFRNAGSFLQPRWEKADMQVIDVGDDATPALADVNGDGKPDLIIGNSTGSLYLYKNTSREGRISFTKDPDYFKGVDVGMYAMPVAVSGGKRVVIIAGNSMGKLYLLERQNGKAGWERSTLKIECASFAAPAFMQDRGDPVPDLIVSDGSGQIHYYKNTKADFRTWDELKTFFAGRIMPGAVCTPAITEISGRSCLVTGNINGELKLYEFHPQSEVLPWIERPDFFRGIKLSSFSRGTVTTWQKRLLLITGQQDGYIRAFLNTGSEDRPVWKEQKDFLKGVPKTLHASPTVFDLDGDGQWELIVGDVDGYVSAYRPEGKQGGTPAWQKIERVFAAVKANRYAAPALVRDSERIYLFVGQQDGSVLAYSATNPGLGLPLFSRDDTLNNIQVSNHSSPSVFLKDGIIEMSVGDYNGNLRHFACRKDVKEVP
jgi:hypothetical protein